MKPRSLVPYFVCGTEFRRSAAQHPFDPEQEGLLAAAHTRETARQFYARQAQLRRNRALLGWAAALVITAALCTACCLR